MTKSTYWSTRLSSHLFSFGPAASSLRHWLRSSGHHNLLSPSWLAESPPPSSTSHNRSPDIYPRLICNDETTTNNLDLKWYRFAVNDGAPIQFFLFRCETLRGQEPTKLTFLSHHEALFNRTDFWEYLSQSFIRGRSWQPVDEQGLDWHDCLLPAAAGLPTTHKRMTTCNSTTT